MPGLRLIVGPPNSGRAGAVRERLAKAGELEPVLVVPTGDDALRFEAELCGPGGAVLGTAIRTFASLVDEIAAAAMLSLPPSLTRSQRLALVRAACARTPFRLLARSARRRGFAAAMADLITELQAALVSPEELERRASLLDDGDGLEGELASVYRSYLELRRESGAGDPHLLIEEAASALRRDPGAWAQRPVFLYAFDDLTEEQLELVAALAGAADVTVAVNYADRDALAARATLRQRLIEDLGAEVELELPAEEEHTESPVLRHLDHWLFEPEAGAVDPDDGLALLESSGERGEAEAIGVEIARLLAAGAVPDALVVVVRHPDRHGDLLRRVLDGMGIPVAVEARLPLVRSAVGRALAAAVRASGEGGSAADVLALLRADPAAPPAIADFLERSLGRSGEAAAAERIAGWSSPPWAVAALEDTSDGPGWLRALARLARGLAELPHLRREPVEEADRALALGDRAAPRGRTQPPFDPLELRASRIAASTLEELAALVEGNVIAMPSREEALAALEDATVPLWRGPTDGRVRVVSPYRARAARSTNLFLVSLQDGDFPAPGGGDPLLGEGRRAALGIPALVRRETAQEERYLFHACVSRPTERLWLSWRSSDENGTPLPRSPFVDDVLDLVPGASHRIRRRAAEEVVPAPGEATTARGLARSLAVHGGASRGERLPPGLVAAIERALGAADERASLPGPFRHPRILAELAERNPVGANTIEKWIDCPFRWLVDHELVPQRLEPAADALTAGSIAHEVLERLYRDPPGEGAIPRPGDLELWRRRAARLLTEIAGERKLSEGRPLAGVIVDRLRAQIDRFVCREAESESPLRPDAALLEARFGRDTEVGPLVLEDLQLHGQIDRIDVDGEGHAIVHDYKTSSKVVAVAKLLDEGKLQLQLYAKAAAELFGLTPVGALYHPLANPKDPRPRGFLLDVPETAGVEVVKSDRIDADQVKETLDAGVERAQESARAMRRGLLDRDPNGGACPPWCRYQPICRMERALHAESSGESEPSGQGVPG